MKMKNIKSVFLISANILLFFLAVSLTTYKVTQKRFDEVLKRQEQSTNQILAYFSNQIRFQSTFPDLPINLNSEITDGFDTLTLRNFIKKERALIVHISTRDCQACSIEILEKFVDHLNNKMESRSIIFLTSFLNLRDYIVYKTTNKSGYQMVQLIENMENVSDWSFCFVADTASNLSSPLLINLNLPQLMDEYLTSITISK